MSLFLVFSKKELLRINLEGNKDAILMRGISKRKVKDRKMGDKDKYNKYFKSLGNLNNLVRFDKGVKVIVN